MRGVRNDDRAFFNSPLAGPTALSFEMCGSTSIDIMRPALAAFLVLAAATFPATARTAAAAPAVQTPLETARAMTPARRRAIQSDLAWVGKYNGLINGEANSRMVTAIKAFQHGRRGKPTGVLNPQERQQLAEAAKKRQARVGWKMVGDPGTGMRTGLPARLVPNHASDAGGTRWTSPSGAIRISLTRIRQADLTPAKLAARERQLPERKVGYSAVKPDFVVLSGTQGAKNFYMRGHLRGNEARILTILYDQASKATMEPVVVAMSSAFDPFPRGAQAVGPPPRRSIEYATGIVVSSKGDIVTDREVVEGCRTIAIAGHGNADRIAVDKARGLTLLRIYGARELHPLALGHGTATTPVTLTGIADPRSQGGAAAASTVNAAVAPVGTAGELSLSPAPGPGFAGAAARDAGGDFAGLARLKPAVVAAASADVPAAQALLTTADAVRGFLAANRVAADGTARDAKTSIVRVICVRK